MFFEQTHLPFQLLGVLEFDESDVALWTAPRPFCALSLRLEGDTEIKFQNRRLHLNSHDLSFFPSHFGYYRRAHRDKMIVFHFSLPFDLGTEPEILPNFKFETLCPLFIRALKEWNRREPGYEYRTYALFYRILAEITSHFSSQAPATGPLVTATLSYLQQHYTSPELNVAALARQAHVSDSYLRRIFRKELGVSPKEYIAFLRFERAKALLNAGYDSIASVAKKVGFSDEKNFATAFKKKFGYPPSHQHYGL